MKKFMNKKIGIVLVSFVFIFICVETGFAVEALSITGKIKSIDSVSGIISVDVTSENCKGVRTFKVPDDTKGDLTSSLIGEKLNFKIDAVRCERGKIYNIVF